MLNSSNELIVRENTLPIAYRTPVLPPTETDETFLCVISKHPFKARIDEYCFKVGTNLEGVLKNLGLNANTPANIYINGVQVTEKDRSRVYPKHDDLLSIRVILQGGGSNISTIMQGIMIAAEIVIGVITGNFALIALAIIQIAVMVMAMTQSSKPVTPKLAGQPQLFTVSGDTNSLAPYSYVPLLLGKRQASPTYYGQYFNETRKQRQYVRILSSVGYGAVDITEIQIKNTALTHYHDVQVEVRLGFPDDPPLTLFDSIVNQESFSVLLLDATANNLVGTGWQSRTSPVNVTRLAVDFSFPTGVQTANDVGNIRWLQINIRIQYALVGTPHGTGDDNWQVRTYDDGSHVLKTVGATITPMLNSDDWEVAVGQYDVRLEFSGVVVSPGGGTDLPKNTIQATAYWIALRTFRSGNPILLPNQACIAMRILGTGQLNGAITDLTCVGESIMRDYDPDSDSWDTFAGAWVYKYREFGNGAKSVALDTGWNGSGKSLKFVFNSHSVSGDGSFVASKYCYVRGPQPKTKQQPAFLGEVYNCSFRYKSSEALASGLTVRVLWFGDVGDHGDPHEILTADEALTGFTTVVANSIPLTTAWAQRTLNGTLVPGSINKNTSSPSPVRWARVELGFNINPATMSGRDITIWLDDVHLDLLNADATAKTNVIPNPSFDYAGRNTRNPASHYRSLLQTDRQVGTTLSDSRLDLAGLEDFWIKNEANQYYHDSIIDDETNKLQALDQICGVGNAAWRRTDGLFSVVIDEPGKKVKHHYTTRTIKEYSWQAPFRDRPHALRVRFANQDLAYKTDEVIAYDKGFSPKGPDLVSNFVWNAGDGSTSLFTGTLPAPEIQPSTLIITSSDGSIHGTDNGLGRITGTGITSGVLSTVDYDGMQISLKLGSNLADGVTLLATYTGWFNTNPATLFETDDVSRFVTVAKQAWKIGMRKLSITRLRTIIHSWTSGIEHIKAQRGDVTFFQHFTPRFAITSARILALVKDGTNIIGVQLDDTVSLKANIQYDLQVRFNNDEYNVFSLAQTSEDIKADTLIFTTPVDQTDPLGPDVGDLVILGDPIQLLIIDMANASNYRERSMQAVAYDPTVYLQEQGEFLFNSIIGATTSLPPPIVDPVGDPNLHTSGPIFNPAVTSFAGAAQSTFEGTKTPSMVIRLAPQSVPNFSPDSVLKIFHRESLFDPTIGSGVHRGYYDPTITYLAGDVVDYDADVNGNYGQWMSLHASNINHEPGNSGDDVWWANITSDAKPVESDGTIYGSAVAVTKQVDAGRLYDVSMRYVSSSGAFGDWLHIDRQQIQSADGLTAGSTDPTAFTIAAGGARSLVGHLQFLVNDVSKPIQFGFIVQLASAGGNKSYRVLVCDGNGGTYADANVVAGGVFSTEPTQGYGAWSAKTPPLASLGPGVHDFYFFLRTNDASASSPTVVATIG